MFKEKLISYLGALGGIFQFVLTPLIRMALYIYPLMFFNFSWWVDSICIFVMIAFPITTLLFWIAGLVAAIMGGQSAFTIVYYVLFVVVCVPDMIKLYRALFSGNDDI